MMGMSLSCSIEHVQTHIAFGSIFPKVEKKLHTEEFEDILELTDWFDCDDLDFRSRVDLCLYVLFPNTRKDCEEFYLNDGPPMRDIYTKGEIGMLEILFVDNIKKLIALRDKLYELSEGWDAYVHNMGAFKLVDKK